MKFNHFKQITGSLLVLVASGCASTTSAPPVLTSSDSVALNSIGAASLGDVITVPVEAGLGTTSVVVTSEYMAASQRLCRRMQTTDGQPVSRVACKNDQGQWILARDLMPSSSRLMSTGTQQAPQFSGAQASILDASAVDAGTFVQDNTELGNVDESDGIVVEAMSVDGISVSDIDAQTSDFNTQSVNNGPISNQAIGNQPMSQLAAVEYIVLANETLWSFAKRTTGNALNWQRIAEINAIDDARTVADGDVLKVPAELSKRGS